LADESEHRRDKRDQQIIQSCIKEPIGIYQGGESTFSPLIASTSLACLAYIIDQFTLEGTPSTTFAQLN